MNQHKFTVFTTTYNRSHLLKRLYASLLQQTYKDFLWLIVDDGSTDDTREVIRSFENEHRLDILYHRKKNGGKHTAMKMGFAMTDTPYMVEIDDDDELLPNALETFSREWQQIEKEGKNDIAEVRALSVNEKGIISGKLNSKKNDKKEDSNYITKDWIEGEHFENVTSWKMPLVKSVDMFDIEGAWLYDRVKLVSESVFWNRLARQYNSRYIWMPLRLYHTDTGDSITQSVFTRQKCWNYVFSLCIIMNELREDAWKNKKHLIKYIAEYMSCGFAVGVQRDALISHLHNDRMRWVAMLISPAAWWVGKRLRKGFQNETSCHRGR